MNESLKAVIVEVTGGNVRNDHIYVHGVEGFFPGDCFGGNDSDSSAAPVELIVGTEIVSTDIDQTKGIFRERGAFRRFFEHETVVEGDLIMIEKIGPRKFSVSKISKRSFKYHL